MRTWLQLVAAGVGVACIVTTSGCRGLSSAEPLDTATSPQASAEPAPLTNAPPVPSGQPLVGRDGGVVATALRGDTAIPADTSFGGANAVHEVAGYTLRAVLRVADLPPPGKGPEVNGVAVESARRWTEPRLTVDLAPGRLRAVMEGAFPLPGGAELRSRTERFGHFLVDGQGASYRVVPPGALRALFGERRLDVAPLSRADISPSSEAGRLLSYRARRVEVTTRAGRALFDLVRLPELGDGGELLCRMVLDLMNAPPFTALCGPDEVPVRTELRWNPRGGLLFEVNAIVRRSDLVSSALAAPPPGATFTDAPLPDRNGELFVPATELALLRNAPVDVPAVPAALQGEVGEGLLAWNATDQLRCVWVDGFPLLWLGPGERRRIQGLPRGRYALEWRTCLGDGAPTAVPVTVPGYTFLGAPESVSAAP